MVVIHTLGNSCYVQFPHLEARSLCEDGVRKFAPSRLDYRASSYSDGPAPPHHTLRFIFGANRDINSMHLCSSNSIYSECFSAGCSPSVCILVHDV